MYKVGFVGWRGMVGSVLMKRMQEESDFDDINPFFFSTSQAGDKILISGIKGSILIDANDIEALAEMDILLSCQGSDYTKKVLGPLREKGWDGHWIDAASTLRMQDDALIVLDPINKKAIDQAYIDG